MEDLENNRMIQKNNLEVDNRIYNVDFECNDSGYHISSSIEEALDISKQELLELDSRIIENLKTIDELTPKCDKTDYILAVSCGGICGLIDIFLVGKPEESILEKPVDAWFEDRTKDFAKLCGWNKNNGDIKSAVKFLEEKFKIPYDQTSPGAAAREVFDLNTYNHHFKSLGHNPTIVGLFYSILDQFNNTSHFVSSGELITLEKANSAFTLYGNDIPSKLFSGFVNWFGHIISDISGSSGSVTRGMGIPVPFMNWINSIIAIKQELNLPTFELEKTINEFALEIYRKGFDTRFLAAQAIPVLINEAIVRLVYSTRRIIKYYKETLEVDRSFNTLWKECEPISNASVKRMLTTAHGTFMAVDVADASIRAISKGGDVTEFILRINIVGVGRFAISIGGEINRLNERIAKENEIRIYERKKVLVEEYIKGLEYISNAYNDTNTKEMIKELKNSNLYKEYFQVTIELAQKRGVPSDKYLHGKEDIDKLFSGGSKNEQN